MATPLHIHIEKKAARLAAERAAKAGATIVTNEAAQVVLRLEADLAAAGGVLSQAQKNKEEVSYAALTAKPGQERISDQAVTEANASVRRAQELIDDITGALTVARRKAADALACPIFR